MKLSRHIKLFEAESWENTSSSSYMTDREQYWKKKITSILLNKSGKWGPYQHALYAKRFQDFILRIVPTKEQSDFTAAVDFDHGVIYVGEGFLVDDAKLYQLNVIIRHELAHVLLMHQIRMTKQLGEKTYSRVSTSQSLFDLLNIIADFEISNRKYTSEDKRIIKNMWLNGKLIQGLVTEDHRADWSGKNVSLEDMYRKLSDELETISSDLAGDTLDYTATGAKVRKGDMITQRGIQAYNYYKDISSPSQIWKPIDEYIAKSKVFRSMAKKWQDLIVDIYEAVKGYSDEQLKNLLKNIAKSTAFEAILINDDLDVLTPEEKFWAEQVIKTVQGNAPDRPKTKLKKADHSKEYRDAYNTIIRSCRSKSLCSDEEFQEIIEAAKAILEKSGSKKA